MCVAGTRWVQNDLLAKYPAADVRVYAVWFNMFPGDSREAWPAELLSDSRVAHWWDESRTVGTFFGARKPEMQPKLTADSNGTGGAVLWDAYLLYDPEAAWEAGRLPTGLMRWGRTIVAARGSLRREFDRLAASDGARRGPQRR